MLLEELEKIKEIEFEKYDFTGNFFKNMKKDKTIIKFFKDNYISFKTNGDVCLTEGRSHADRILYFNFIHQKFQIRTQLNHLIIFTNYQNAYDLGDEQLKKTKEIIHALFLSISKSLGLDGYIFLLDTETYKDGSSNYQFRAKDFLSLSNGEIGEDLSAIILNSKFNTKMESKEFKDAFYHYGKLSGQLKRNLEEIRDTIQWLFKNLFVKKAFQYKRQQYGAGGFSDFEGFDGQNGGGLVCNLVGPSGVKIKFDDNLLISIRLETDLENSTFIFSELNEKEKPVKKCNFNLDDREGIQEYLEELIGKVSELGFLINPPIDTFNRFIYNNKKRTQTSGYLKETVCKSLLLEVGSDEEIDIEKLMLSLNEALLNKEKVRNTIYYHSDNGEEKLSQVTFLKIEHSKLFGIVFTEQAGETKVSHKLFDCQESAENYAKDIFLKII